MRLIDADALIGPIKLQEESYRRCGAIERAEAYANCLWEIEQAQTVGDWISVKDRMPEKYIDVLVLVQYPKVDGYTGHYVVIAWKSNDDDSWDSDNDNFNNDPEGVVTHWMPLPEKPKEESDV